MNETQSKQNPAAFDQGDAADIAARKDFQPRVLEAALRWVAHISNALPAAVQAALDDTTHLVTDCEPDEYDAQVHDVIVLALAHAIEQVTCNFTDPRIVSLYSAKARQAHVEQIVNAICQEAGVSD